MIGDDQKLATDHVADRIQRWTPAAALTTSALVNLLLLLSAMLSALTGAMTGARADAPRQVAAASVVTVAEAVTATRTQITARPLAPLPTRIAVAAMAPARAFTVATPQPYMSRRRE